MKQLKGYINIRKGKSTIKATNETIQKIVKDELDRLGNDANLNHIDVSKVTSMRHLFDCHISIYANLDRKYKYLNPDISLWNVHNVEDMGFMFYECEDFNCNIGDWNIEKCKNMEYMLYHCESFNQDLSNWDLTNVHKSFMLTKCPIKEEYKPKLK